MLLSALVSLWPLMVLQIPKFQLLYVLHYMPSIVCSPFNLYCRITLLFMMVGLGQAY